MKDTLLTISIDPKILKKCAEIGRKWEAETGRDIPAPIIAIGICNWLHEIVRQHLEDFEWHAVGPHSPSAADYDRAIERVIAESRRRGAPA